VRSNGPAFLGSTPGIPPIILGGALRNAADATMLDRRGRETIDFLECMAALSRAKPARGQADRSFGSSTRGMP
jgi:hypothetical protein